MSKKSSGLSGVFTVIVVIILIARVAMIMSRNSSNSTHANWNSSYLMWSVFVLVAVVGSYFWNQSKKEED
ncbi:MAG: DMSO reductase anchor subunit [Polaribacter sp.]|jgi:DMSO reductase anchor subunit